MIAVQKEAFPLAGLLSKVMAQTLAKLNRMMKNDDAANLTKPDIEKCASGSVEGLSVVTTRGWEDLSVITTRAELSFVTSTRGEFLDSIKKGSNVNAALRSCASLDHSSGVPVLALRRWISSLAILTNCRIFSPALVPISSICASDASAPLRLDSNLLSSSSLSWRRVISPCIAVMMKPALLSPSIFTASIPSITSCGTRTVVSCDFAFLLGVAIAETPLIWCVSIYTKSEYIKTLMCISYLTIVKHTLSTGKAQAVHKIAKPRSAQTLTGPLTTNDIQVSRQL